MTTPEIKPLTAAETKLLQWALERFSDILGCAGCNDFDLKVDGDLGEEWPEVAQAINSRRDPCDQVESVKSWSFPDWEVVGYLRARISGKV